MRAPYAFTNMHLYTQTILFINDCRTYCRLRNQESWLFVNLNDIIAVNRRKETVNAIYLVCTYTLNVLYLACTCIFIGFVFQQVNVDLLWGISACTYLLMYIFNICLTSSGARFSRSRIPPKRLNRIHSQMQYLYVQYLNVY